MKHNGEMILNIPVNAGIVGGVAGMYFIPWAMIISAATAFGLGCNLEFSRISKDGWRSV
ncbi:DUF4342 domain-containing protein [Butyrivibrio sp. INlla16]|uniref:DUF4342 domain-containing protein n=1 Tax=Butyrivibrio sp. INlla16 TaxID=1520807 RepID=UPI0034DCE312